MTGDNQNAGDPGSTAATFGSDQGQNSNAPVFGKDDFDKILNQNRNAQDHIKTLESETAAMRAELQRLQEELIRSKSIDDLLSQMRQQDSTTTSPGTTSPQFDQEQLLKTLKAEVFRDLTQAQQQSLEIQNWNHSVAALRERHGEGYASYVDQRAKELDIPIPKLEELAKTSPNAFVELVSGKGTRSAAPTMGSQIAPPKNDADTEAMYVRINTLRYRNTPEGNEAKRVWSDPTFQQKYRMFILEKGKSKGSQFGNNL